MMDLHQRFIGTLSPATPLSIGETVIMGASKAYTVVSIDASRSRDKNVKSVTVIANNPVSATEPIK